MIAYKINVLRTVGTCEIYKVQIDAALIPPEKGDAWDLPGIADLSSVAMIEIVGGGQVAKPWYVWQVTFEFLSDAEDRHYYVAGARARHPAVPVTGTWWAMKASRGDNPADDPKNNIYVRRSNLLVIDYDPGASPVVCQ